MELKDFISQTLTQIIEGVIEAQTNSSISKAEFNPHLTIDAAGLAKAGLMGTGRGRPAQNVKFDIALTVTEGKGTKGGIGVFLGAASLGSSGESRSDNSSLSRVQFSVPVKLPVFDKPPE